MEISLKNTSIMVFGAKKNQNSWLKYECVWLKKQTTITPKV
jgi:hypothetical protein